LDCAKIANSVQTLAERSAGCKQPKINTPNQLINCLNANKFIKKKEDVGEKI